MRAVGSCSRGLVCAKECNANTDVYGCADTPFKQQKLKAWQPILTPNWVIGSFALVGLIFIPIGIILHTESDNVRRRLL